MQQTTCYLPIPLSIMDNIPPKKGNIYLVLSNGSLAFRRLYNSKWYDEIDMPDDKVTHLMDEYPNSIVCSVEDLEAIWSDGYHRRVDEEYGRSKRYLTDILKEKGIRI